MWKWVTLKEKACSNTCYKVKQIPEKQNFKKDLTCLLALYPKQQVQRGHSASQMQCHPKKEHEKTA